MTTGRFDAAPKHMRHKKKVSPLVVSDEQNEIKIYTVKGRAAPLYQLCYYRAGERVRKTFADVNEARREARLTLGQLAGERMQTRNLSALEMESYAIASKTLELTGVPLHVCAELFGEAHRILKGRSILDAAKYYMRHFDPERPRKPIRDFAKEFVDSREALGTSPRYIVACNTVMNMMLRAFDSKNLDDITTKDLDQMLESSRQLRNRTRNNRRIILVCFGNFLKKRGYLPIDRPSAFDGMIRWKNEIEAVTIYTPEEMGTLLSSAPLSILPYLAIGAFAGLRSAEICRLNWEDVKLERGFIECDAQMTKTRSRRLVPISENLRAWLEPVRRPCGRVVQYQKLHQALGRFHQRIDFEWKRNALRHSYISYRLALMPDTARVALECGNSPDVIFKHYRELVEPEQATKWFELRPPEGYPANATGPECKRLIGPVAVEQYEAESSSPVDSTAPVLVPTKGNEKMVVSLREPIALSDDEIFRALIG